MEGVISAIEASVYGGVETQDTSAPYSACEKVCQLTSILYYNVTRYLHVFVQFVFSYRYSEQSCSIYTRRTSCCPPG